MENKNEFDYVFKACAGKIRPAAINDLLSVPEFVEELRKFDGEMNNQNLYELSEKVSNFSLIKRFDGEFKQKMISEQGIKAWKEWENRHLFLINVNKRVKASVLGRDAENKNEFNYLYDCCEGRVHPALIMDLLSIPEFVEELRKFGKEINIELVNNIAERVRAEYHNGMYSDEFKQKFVSEKGDEAWRVWKYQYRFLANACRKLKKA